MMSGSNSNRNFLSFDENEDSDSLYENSPRNSTEKVEYRQDGRPKRKTKKKKHFDEEYPPEEQTPKKRKSNIRINSKSNMAVILPQIPKKSLGGIRKSIKDAEELHSDDEEYKRANLRATPQKGFSAANFLIRKYINKVKYCFDKLRILSVENSNKPIELHDKDLECLKGISQSSGYTYLEHDLEEDRFNLVVSRTPRPFIGKYGSKNGLNYTRETERQQSGNSLSGLNLNGDVYLNLEEAEEHPEPFFKFNPKDVLGSNQLNKSTPSLEPDGTPAAKELLNPNRKISKDIDKSDSDEKDDSDYKDNLDEETKAFLNSGVYTLTHPLKEQGLKEEGCSESTYENMFFHKHDIKNIEVIRLRAYFEYYHKLQHLYDDLMTLLKYTLDKRCKNLCAKYYVTELIYKVQTLFRDKKRIEEFKKLYKEDFDYKFEMNILLRVQGKWEKKPGPQRKYFAVNDYVPVTKDEDTLKRMVTSKTSKCNGDC